MQATEFRTWFEKTLSLNEGNDCAIFKLRQAVPDINKFEREPTIWAAVQNEIASVFKRTVVEQINLMLSSDCQNFKRIDI